MPCNSDYMEQTKIEKETTETAKLLFFLINSYYELCGTWLRIDKLYNLTPKKRVDFVTKIENIKVNYYPKKDESDFIVKAMCKLITHLRKEKKYELLINDFGNETHLQIAQWVLNHDKADKERKGKTKDYTIKQINKQHHTLIEQFPLDYYQIESCDGINIFQKMEFAVEAYCEKVEDFHDRSDEVIYLWGCYFEDNSVSQTQPPILLTSTII